VQQGRGLNLPMLNLALIRTGVTADDQMPVRSLILKNV
jgi:hypothetical protein